VTGIGCAHCGRETKGVPHFANHDNVRILTQDVFKSMVKRKRVETNFTLLDHTLVILEDIFDWVFEGDDVLFGTGIDMFNHCRKGGGFAATGRTSHQKQYHEEIRLSCESAQEVQLLETWNMRFDIAHRQTPLAALLEKICSKSANIGDEVGKVGFALVGDFLAQMRRSYLLDNFLHPIVGRLRALDGNKLLINPKNYRASDFQVHVRGPALDCRFQNAMKHFHAAEASRSARGANN